ncbi:hypothetical protein HanRHA438_Chr03g0119361 [Helianthus annuus]|nr:hypothetical protein HanRHA438_Chr03g0119361 [Helianthus annuus]
MDLKNQKMVKPTLRPCVVVKNYNAPIMRHYSTRVISVSIGHYSIKWCSGKKL